MKKRITIVATADIQSYIGVDCEGAYYVLTLDDIKEIELHDHLEGEFDGEGDLFYSVKNLTQQTDVAICLEDWECTLDSAITTILKFIGENRAVVFAGRQKIQLPRPDAAAQIRDAVHGRS